MRAPLDGLGKERQARTKAEAMKCEQAQAMMGRYLDGELSAPERRCFDKHIARCRQCRQELNLAGTVVHLLETHRPDTSVKAPPHLWDAIQDRLEK